MQPTGLSGLITWRVLCLPVPVPCLRNGLALFGTNVFWASVFDQPINRSAIISLQGGTVVIHAHIRHLIGFLSQLILTIGRFKKAK